MIDSILQRPLGMWKCLCTTPEAHVFADIIAPLFTPPTLFTRQPDLERNLVSNFEVGNLGSHSHDYTRRLVTQGHGLLHDNVAIAVVSVVMEI